MVDVAHENLTTSIVFQLEPEPLKKIGFTPRELEGLLKPRVNVVQTLDGRLVLTSIADQVEIYLGPARFDVRDLSGKDPGEKPLATIMAQLIEKFGGRPKAIGFNYEFSYSTPEGNPSGAFLAKAFLAQNEFIKQVALDGAAVTLYYPKGAKRCTIKLEPRWGDPKSNSVYVNINVHEELPPGENAQAKPVDGRELQAAFTAEYTGITRLLSTLFEK